MQTLSKRQIAWGALVLLLLVNAVFIWLLVPHGGTLKVSFLNVGQGDSILIQGPTGVDMLVDGGRDKSVLRELPKVMGVVDRNIDVVVATHPDADHISGLADVFERYQVGHFFEPGIKSDTATSQRLAAAVATEPGVEKTVARRGERIALGDGAYAEILYPDKDVATMETNTGSIVMRVVYGTTEFMLTGDAPSSVEDYLVSLDGTHLESDVLKAGHHGSRTSTDTLWLNTVKPSVVVISAGKDNSYGHPHPETLNRIQTFGARVLSTIDSGTIQFTSDGRVVRQK